jgi:glycosyltransferase involved in cell wall biosynthesis
MNGGAANARNYGIQICKCDLYAFLDSDDIWLPSKLERQLPIFTDSSIAMVGCLTTMGGRVAGSSTSTGLRIVGLRQQLFKNHFQTSTVIVRRSVIDSLGTFPVNQRYAEEGDLFNRIAARYRCVLVPEVLVDYGYGKQGFGDTGLSANLFDMEKGELSNIRRAFRRRDCGYGLYLMASTFSLVKFLRRYLITVLRRLWAPS